MPTQFRFASFVLNADARQLLEAGVAVPLGGRAFDLLLYLLKHRERVVSKAELMDAVWPDSAVIENNLNAQVSALRKVLGPDAVQNVTGRGYRFGLEAREDQPGPPTRRAEARSTIAVLPFENLTGDPEQEYFACGMAEDILTALSCFSQLIVIARNASFACAERTKDPSQVAQLLGAHYRVTGSVRRATNWVRIHVALVEAQQGAQIWAQNFDAEAQSLFAVQDEIAARVVSVIEPKLRDAQIKHARAKPPGTLAAYDMYLRALPHLYAFRPADNAVAVDLLEQALALEPNFATAMAYAAWGYEQRLNNGFTNAVDSELARAVELARAALAAGEQDSNVIGLSGFVIATIGKDLDCGMAALRRATQLNPNNALIANSAGTLNLFKGDLEQAGLLLERARRLSPGDPAAYLLLTGLACVRLLQGASAEALALCIESVSVKADWNFTWWVMASASGQRGDLARAGVAFTQLSRLRRESPLAFPSFTVFSDLERRALFLDGLRKAGLADGAGQALP